MEFRDLGAQYAKLKKEIDTSIQEVIQRSAYIFGSQVTELERKLAIYTGVKHCISCANGTDALQLVLMAWGIGEGDAVFVPDFTFFATAGCASIVGSTPVLVDIDICTFNMSPIALEKAILKTIQEGKLNPKVIIPVDLFGQPANYPQIAEIARKYNLKILEDGAQGFGGSINGQRVCSFGDAATTSFFPAKPLGCYGDGGAIFTNDDEMDEILRSLRAQGRSPEDKYDNRMIGMNSRLDTLQAAILLPKLKAFDEYEIKDSNKVALWYTEQLEKIVTTPYVPNGYLSSWAQYTILLKNMEQRDNLQKYLKLQNIPSMIYYPRGLHQQTAYKDQGNSDSDFPNTANVVQRVLSLPMHPYLDKNIVFTICSAIKDSLRN